MDRLLLWKVKRKSLKNYFQNISRIPTTRHLQDRHSNFDLISLILQYQ